MGNTYYKLYVQCVFAVKYRNAVIHPSWRPDLMRVIGNLINETGCTNMIVNGVEDHVHCLFHMKPTHEISDIMQAVKAKSSKWVNENGLLKHRFEWQEGFGAFTYSRWDVDKIYHYIMNQAKHHQSEIFKHEYIRMLKEFDVDYDEKYLFDELI